MDDQKQTPQNQQIITPNSSDPQQPTIPIVSGQPPVESAPPVQVISTANSVVGTNDLTPKKNHKSLFISLFVLLVLIAGLGGWYYLYHNDKYSAKNYTSSTKQNSCKPEDSSTTINAVAVKYIDIPCSLAHFNSGAIIGESYSQGHYLYADSTGYKTTSLLSRGGKLVYDGSTVYQSSGLNQLVYALSFNGQHYIYASGSSTGTSDIYVDNKNVASGNVAEPIAVSNNGQGYAYTTDDAASGGQDLYKDTSLLYKSGFNIMPSFSADLSHYIAVEEGATTPPVFNIVLDGKILDTTSDPNLADNISDNGQHYIYSDDGTMVVDGKAIANVSTAQSPTDDLVTDNGTYAYTECSLTGSSFVFIESKPYSTANCDGQDTGQLVVSPDGSHFVYGSSSYGWLLDGKKITLPGSVANVEFVNDTLYVYRWIN